MMKSIRIKYESIKIQREYGNYSKTKDLTLQEEKNAIYKAGYAEYVDKLKAKLPAELVFKITQFQAGKPVIKAVQ